MRHVSTWRHLGKFESASDIDRHPALIALKECLADGLCRHNGLA
jgi:hypothetical protein